MCQFWHIPLFVRPAWANSTGCKSRACPDSGKRIAKDKGVHREVESEGSPRQRSDLTYRNQILRLLMRMSLQNKTKSNNYSESLGVNLAGIRRKEFVLNWGGLTDVISAYKTLSRSKACCEKSAEDIVL